MAFRNQFGAPHSQLAMGDSGTKCSRVPPDTDYSSMALTEAEIGLIDALIRSLHVSSAWFLESNTKTSTPVGK